MDHCHYLSSPMPHPQPASPYDAPADRGAARGAPLLDLAKSSPSSPLSSSSASRSPTTIFAVDVPRGVFRVPDDERREAPSLSLSPPVGDDDDDDDDVVGASVRASPFAFAPSASLGRRRSAAPSLGTDGELSTFSEDTEEGEGIASSSSSSSSDDDEAVGSSERRWRRLSLARRPPALPRLSIFRPVGGIKRRCDFDDEDGERRPRSAPPLRRAAPVGDRSDDESGGDRGAMGGPSARDRACRSPFKRVRLDRAAASPFAALFAEGPSAPTPTMAAIPMDEGRGRRLLGEHLRHPLAFSGTSSLRSSSASSPAAFPVLQRVSNFEERED
ncbi:hypothetical protein ACHAWF_017407 [Thalassiosira exigua]